MRVLLVEDEPEMAALVALDIEAQGFAVDCVGSIDEALTAVRLARYGLVVLDRRLPDGDGIAILPELRRGAPGAPVLALTALDAVPDRVRGLDAGADDYLAKPFDIEELRARIRAALRRPGAGASPPISVGRLRFDPNSREVSVGGEVLVLQRRELALLETLVRRARRVVQRATLLNEVYGFDEEPSSNTLDAHVSRLRKRLTRLGSGVAIHPVRGVGYMLDEA
jgi:DNA-binding response OmpR family regulator